MIEHPRTITIKQDRSQLRELGRALHVLREHHESDTPGDDDEPILDASLRTISTFIGEFLDEADRVPGNEDEDEDKPDDVAGIAFLNSGPCLDCSGKTRASCVKIGKPCQVRINGLGSKRDDNGGGLVVVHRHRHTWGTDGKCTTIVNGKPCTAKPRPRKGKGAELPGVADAD